MEVYMNEEKNPILEGLTVVVGAKWVDLSMLETLGIFMHNSL